MAASALVEGTEHLATRLLSDEEFRWEAYIFKVPAFKRELNHKAFTPEFVSIGPFHHGNPGLTEGEDFKKRSFVNFIKRASLPLQKIVHKLSEHFIELRAPYYTELRSRYTDEEFLFIMLVDGCFMLEVLEYYAGRYMENGNEVHHYIYRKWWPYIRRDMLLIENQLPTILMDALVPFVQTATGHQGFYFHRLVFRSLVGYEEYPNFCGMPQHVLSIYRQSLLYPIWIDYPEEKDHRFVKFSTTPTAIRCAAELHQAGVSFKKSKTKSLNDVHFNSKTGEFHLPFIMVNDDTECFFLNIMTFEHLSAPVSTDVTSYVCIMVELIDSAKDVSLLVDKGIISNSLGSDKAVAGLFNRIIQDVKVAPDSNLLRVRRDVSEYCKKKRNRWRANLIQTYFNNPWSALSLAGALLLLGLTIIQTVYSIHK